MSHSALTQLEEQFGTMTLWEWTRDWMDSEAECDQDEHMPLLEYLWMSAGQEGK